MSELEHTWQSSAFDAISIMLRDGEITIEASDGDQVELSAENVAHDLNLEPVGRWLRLAFWRRSDLELTLRLPKNKSWVIDVSGGRGEIQIHDVQARFQVMLGKGEIEIANCRGIFNVMSGNGQVEMQHCVETEMPERPPMPQGEPEFQTANPGRHEHEREEFRNRRMRSRPGWDWDWNWDWAEGDWSAWGMQIAEQATQWAQQFSHTFDWMGWKPENAGINVQMGKGNAKIQDIDANTCAIGLGKGNVELQDGRIAQLGINTARGDVECENILPISDWEIKTTHGDIHLVLPANAQGKLDVATRHGDIHSDVSLVRVGRPGPGARYGGRMVGTFGQPGDKASEISLETLKGDIHIEQGKSQSQSGDKPREAKSPATEVAAPQPVNANPSTNATETSTADAAQDKPAYESHMAVLQALSEKKITVDEAEQLLRSL